MLDSDRMAKRREPHSVPESYGTRCDGCQHLSCIERKGAKLYRYSYYCEKLRRKMEQKDLYEISVEMCPIRRELKRRFR